LTGERKLHPHLLNLKSLKLLLLVCCSYFLPTVLPTSAVAANVRSQCRSASDSHRALAPRSSAHRTRGVTSVWIYRAVLVFTPLNLAFDRFSQHMRAILKSLSHVIDASECPNLQPQKEAF
jgi:hypothetical protein